MTDGLAWWRAEICRVGRSLFERGLVHSTAGNISVRLPADLGGGYLITPTEACLGFLEPARLAHVDPDGRQLGGDRASKTLALHRRIYGADESLRCVLHTHSTNLVALTVAGLVEADSILPPLTAYQVMKVGPVPLIGWAPPGDLRVAEEVAARVARSVAERRVLRAVMLDRLGPVVWHHSLAEAMATLEELEETARIRMLCGPRATALNAAQLRALRDAFGASW